MAFEPEAAGYRFTRTLDGPATVLIGDFGGGTSDFSLLRFEPGAERPVTALATTGVGVAGDSFDFRIIDRVVLFDDALPLRSGVVPGESAAAADVSARIADGQRPEEAVAGSGVRYVAAELGTAPPVDTALLRSLGTVVVDEEHLLVVDVGGPAAQPEWRLTHALGWGVTILTWLTVATWVGATGSRRMLPTGLLRFRA